MNISLAPELEQLINDRVKTGLYQTANEVIREGLRLLRERDQRVEALRRTFLQDLKRSNAESLQITTQATSRSLQTALKPEVVNV